MLVEQIKNNLKAKVDCVGYVCMYVCACVYVNI